MRPTHLLLVLVVGVVLFGASRSVRAPLQTDSAVKSRTFTFEHDDRSHELDYCGNGPIDAAAAVRRVVIVVHGDERNACDYAEWTASAAMRAGAASSTLVVAPDFVTASEVPSSDRRRPYWTDDGWKDGSLSRTSPHQRAGRVSSFSVVDAMVTRLRAELPEVPIVVVGHSAGGQFVNRYAATSRVGADRYVVANPSSFLYFTGERLLGGEFRLPTRDERDACGEYNEYKYGLEDPYAYVSDDADTITKRYATREVTYLLGGRDTQRDDVLDTSCESDAQGTNRLERGRRYHAHLREVLGPAAMRRHTLSIVSGVGHDGAAMLASDTARDALFG